MVPSLFRVRSPSFNGMAGCWPLGRAGTALSNLPPKSGLAVALRYLVHQLVSMVNCFKLVRRPFWGTPVTRLGGRTAKFFVRSMAFPPFDSRQLLRNLWGLISCLG